MKKLLLLHGVLGSKNQFMPLKKILEADFEIYDFNFEGHGGSILNKDFSIQLFTENMISFIKKMI